MSATWRSRKWPLSSARRACCATLASAKPRACVFLVPSLINRYYILDLTRRLSFARYLSGQGFEVCIIDWGTPSQAEKDFDCSDYITDRLLPFVREAKGALPLILGGYCMGGLLALALASLEPELVDAIACLATPWDFASPDFPSIPFDAAMLERFLTQSGGARVLSAEIIQYLFHYVNPLPFQTRIREFGRMEENHPQRQPFLASQLWANDGVPMVERVARECLLGWIGDNIPARGLWSVGGAKVNPAALRHPAFIALSHADTIVPASCSLPLAAVDEGGGDRRDALRPCRHDGRQPQAEQFVGTVRPVGGAPIRLTLRNHRQYKRANNKNHHRAAGQHLTESGGSHE